MPYRPNSQKPTNLPYTKHSSDSDAVADIGGPTVEFTAGGNLNLGDAVYLSAANTVNKSIVAADTARFVGIVVGGARLANYVNTEQNKYGVIQAAAATERVIVQNRGIAYVLTEAAYAASTNLVMSTTTAGRVLTNGAARGNLLLIEASSGAGAAAKAIIF